MSASTTDGPTTHRRRPRSGPARGVVAGGEPAVWLAGASLALCLAMIGGLLGLIVWQGGRTFWPGELVRVTLRDGRTLLGEDYGGESFTLRAADVPLLPAADRPAARVVLGDAEEVEVGRTLYRTDLRDFGGRTFTYVDAFSVTERERPEWAVVVEREERGRVVGEPVRAEVRGEIVEGPAEAFAKLAAVRPAAAERAERREELEEAIGRAADGLREADEAVRAAELKTGGDGLKLAQELVAGGPGAVDPAALVALPDPLRAAVEAYAAEGRRAAAANAPRLEELRRIERAQAGERLVLRIAGGRELPIEMGDVVRTYRANELSFLGRLRIYLARWWEFVSDDPRQAGTAGGVFPAIWGTVVMTLGMTVAVVPFGVLAALYLREYATQGLVVAGVRVAVNNLAGVPSIVFGVFGLAFFVYLVGGGIDEVFYAERLPVPTFGKIGVLWASLTLALLTLPVVIVATEEALSAVPNSMREGSYACGASKWQTIRRIVLPRALPGILTGTILAVARGAGEVAPLMLVGAVNSAPALPVDAEFPFVHPTRSFMHLGLHIYDLGFQAPDSDAAIPMAFAAMLLLIGLVAVLNLAAMWLRARLRRRFVSASF